MAKVVHMNKPMWKYSPSWATHFALSPEGKWYWYSLEPWLDEAQTKWCYDECYRISFAGTYGSEDKLDWMKTLEERPND